MPLLTEQEIRDVARSVKDIGEHSDRALILAAQKSVIEKIKAQGVAAWASDDGRTVIPADDVGYIPNWTDYYRTPLYKISD